MNICDHRYKHLETVKYETHSGNTVKWDKCDRFFCEKCLDIKEVSRVEIIEAYKGKPSWY